MEDSGRQESYKVGSDNLKSKRMVEGRLVGFSCMARQGRTNHGLVPAQLEIFRV